MGLGFSVAGLTFNTTDSRCCQWSPRSCVGHRVLGLFSEFQLCPPLPAGPAHLRYTGSRAPVSGWVDFCCLYVVPDLLWARRVPFSQACLLGPWWVGWWLSQCSWGSWSPPFVCGGPGLKGVSYPSPGSRGFCFHPSCLSPPLPEAKDLHPPLGVRAFPANPPAGRDSALDEKKKKIRERDIFLVSSPAPVFLENIQQKRAQK